MKILEKVVVTIMFLGSNGLSFRGKNEIIGQPNCGNFLGIIELLTQFDPFLAEHIKLYEHKGSGRTSFLSKTIYEELITLMAEKIEKHVLDEVQEQNIVGSS